MDELIQLLKVLLADLSAFRIKTQYYHWNIEGPDFTQYHKFLLKIYNKAAEDADGVAEHIRALGYYAPGSLLRFTDLTNIRDEDTVPEALIMLDRTLVDNKIILNSAGLAATVAERLVLHGTLNFLEGLIDSYERQAWMLKSTTKRS